MKLYSASQVTNFRACQRLWAWEKLAGVTTTMHPAAALGQDAHSQLEAYLTHETEFDYTTKAGLVASALLGFLPAPHTGHCEKHWTLPSSIGEWGYQGYIDYYAPGQASNGLQRPDRAARVIDFKTTSDLKWAKSTDDLRTDPQAVLYSVFAFVDTNTPTVDLEWLYSQTRGASKVRRVHLRVVADDVVDAFLAIEATAETMHAIVAAAPGEAVDDYVRTLPPSPARCQAYGGCPHRMRCALSPDLIIDSYGNQTTMPTPAELIASLNARKAAANATQATLPTVTPATAAASASLGVVPEETPRQMQLPGAAGIVQALNIPTTLFVDIAPAIPAPAINPPESLLPDAPAVVKAKGGRPKGSVNKPKQTVQSTFIEGPEVSGGLDVEPSDVDGEPGIIYDASERCPTIPAPPRMPSTTADYRGERVSVTWAEETFTPVPYNTFKIGPFTLEGFTRPGESLDAALTRLYRDLEAFAIKERRMKAESFRATIGGV